MLPPAGSPCHGPHDARASPLLFACLAVALIGPAPAQAHDASGSMCRASDEVRDPTPNDLDDDCVTDSIDNCYGVANPDQVDCDGDGRGDACQDDDDSDGVLDTAGQLPHDPEPRPGEHERDEVRRRLLRRQRGRRRQDRRRGQLLARLDPGQANNEPRRRRATCAMRTTTTTAALRSCRQLPARASTRTRPTPTATASATRATPTRTPVQRSSPHPRQLRPRPPDRTKVKVTLKLAATCSARGDARGGMPTGVRCSEACSVGRQADARQVGRRASSRSRPRCAKGEAALDGAGGTVRVLGLRPHRARAAVPRARSVARRWSSTSPDAAGNVTGRAEDRAG